MAYSAQIIGFLLGFAFGLLVSWINFLLIKKATRAEDKAAAQPAGESVAGIVKAYIIKLFLDVASLMLAFFLRNWYPYPYTFVLLGVAIALLVPGRIMTVKFLNRQNKK